MFFWNEKKKNNNGILHIQYKIQYRTYLTFVALFSIHFFFSFVTFSQWKMWWKDFIPIFFFEIEVEVIWWGDDDDDDDIASSFIGDFYICGWVIDYGIYK